MTELDLFRSGLDTYDIARKTGQSEASVYNAIARQREGITEPCFLYRGPVKTTRRNLVPYAGAEAR